METKIGSYHVLKILLYIIAWIIFVGLCIEASAVIVYLIYTLAYEPPAAGKLYFQEDLSALYHFDRGYFAVETGLMIIVAVMKAVMFYRVVSILHGTRFSMAQPFNKPVRRFILTLSYLALLIGLFSYWGVKYRKWFLAQDVSMPDIEQLGFGGADVWLFMSVVFFVIAHIFKRGIEIQTENDLTI